MVRVLARVLAAKGARLLQIDEPSLAGYPEEVGVAVEAVNIVTTGVDVTWGLHVCYGNRYVRPSWERHDDFLFPANKLIINPDCGLCHLPAHVTRSKLAVMVEGTMAVRRTLPIQAGSRTVTSAEPTVEQGA
jgi:methionine synthase II (cobalamin-independent)